MPVKRKSNAGFGWRERRDDRQRQQGAGANQCRRDCLAGPSADPVACGRCGGTQTLEAPYWAPQRKGVRLVPRPGHVAEFDFPVILTSDIDGTVYLVEKTARRSIGDVMIELLDRDRRVVSAIKSSSDGYYIVPAVSQGRCHLRVSPTQLKQFDRIDPGERDITILPDGKFITGVDFLLSRNPAGTVSDLPREQARDKK